MKNLTNWSRLASAALTAPDDLRYLIRALDQTIAAKAPSISLLIRVREIAIHNVESRPPGAQAPATTKKPTTSSRQHMDSPGSYKLVSVASLGESLAARMSVNATTGFT